MAPRAGRIAVGLLAAALLAAVGSGCGDSTTAPRADAGAPPAGLTPQQAAAVIAKVGDETITLGEYAAALERMNQFDRMRYQSKERRRALLQDLIDIKLLAQEARRRGLDQKPEVQDAIRQILRDAILAKARRGLPSPAEIPAAEVKAYYEAHIDAYREPERRRVSAIVLDDADKAAEVLEKAVAIKSGNDWGELFHEHSLTAPKERNPRAPADLAGDLGITGPPGEAKGANKNVPEAVQRAIFGLAQVGDVHEKVIPVGDDRFFVVRLAGRSKGHTRSLSEADRTIRVAILQQMVRDREKQLADELRKRFPVEIDKDALSAVKLPPRPREGDDQPIWQPVPSSSAAAQPGDSAAPANPPQAPPSPSAAP